MDARDKLVEKLKELIKLMREQSTYQGKYTFSGLCDSIAALDKQVKKQKSKEAK